jgi:hypothetical protein
MVYVHVHQAETYVGAAHVLQHGDAGEPRWEGCR